MMGSPEPFAPAVRGLDEVDPARAAMRAGGPVVRVDAPAGGAVWVVTEDALARQVLNDPRIAKDPAHAPPGWDPLAAGLEPTAAEQLSLTTLDGPAHAELRRAHAPLLTGQRVRAYRPRITAIARELLAPLADAGGAVDLMADFTTRYPLTVLFDLLGVPAGLVDQGAEACRRMWSDDPEDRGAAMGAFAGLSAAALSDGRRGMATELRDRVPDATSEADVHYLVFTLLFAGQLTTDAALGFLVARALGDDARPRAPVDDLVRATLRRHPPAPYTLWRFTTQEVELAGVRLPARAPVLVDIQGINTDPRRADGSDLTFGAGPHVCIGAQLATLELAAVVEVLRADHPRARLAAPLADLRQVHGGGITGSRLATLPVILDP